MSNSYRRTMNRINESQRAPGSRNSGGRSSRGSYRRDTDNSLSPQDDDNSSNLSISTLEQLERRRLRFEAERNRVRSEYDYGFTSRGEDNRLQRDPNARIAYFKHIQQQFAESFSDVAVDSLRDMFSRITFDEEEPNKAKFDRTLLSLRKLREALLKHKPDELTKSVFLFSVRISSRVGHYQTYVPSINYLIKHRGILNKQELNEIINIYVIHLSHFSHDDYLAFELLIKYAKDDLRLNQLLNAWKDLNYAMWFDLFNTEQDISKFRIMKFGEERMMSHAIRCINISYFQLPITYIEEIFHKELHSLDKYNPFDWKVGETIVTTRPRTTR